MMQTEEMSSSYRPPDPRKQLSARIRGSIHAKLAVIVEMWRERAKANGADEDEIDLTYVVDHLLADKTDEELTQWGGMPSTPEQRAEMIKAVRSASKKHH